MLMFCIVVLVVLLVTVAPVMIAARIVGATGWDHPLFLGLVTMLAACVRSVAFWLVLRAEHPIVALGSPAAHAALWSAALDALVVVAATAALRNLRPPL